jgi:hypothetical protein
MRLNLDALDQSFRNLALLGFILQKLDVLLPSQ